MGGDRKLAQNAQLYHYQHQKQQMIAFDSNGGNDSRNGTVSDNESDGEEGDYTVYECPGLAPLEKWRLEILCSMKKHQKLQNNSNEKDRTTRYKQTTTHYSYFPANLRFCSTYYKSLL